MVKKNPGHLDIFQRSNQFTAGALNLPQPRHVDGITFEATIGSECLC